MHARFVLSAASAADFPAAGLPEIALVGRSNVGKSSLINALTKLKIARTSAAPGKTRLANFYQLPLIPNPRSPVPGPQSLFLVDLPGYGYARGGRESVQTFEKLTREYFDPARRNQIAGVLHLIDARHPDLPQDAAASEWLQRAGVPSVVVATKIDKLTRPELARHLITIQSGLGAQPLAVSSTGGHGLDAVWKQIRLFVTYQAQ